MTAAAFVLTLIFFRPIHEERHPTVQFDYADCWHRGLDQTVEEARCGYIMGFRCEPVGAR